MVARRGDPQGGTVLVKLYNPAARVAKLYVEAASGDGDRVWMSPLGSTEEADIDAYVERQKRIDPDLWLVEIEDREGRHFLTEPAEQSQPCSSTGPKANRRRMSNPRTRADRS